MVGHPVQECLPVNVLGKIGIFALYLLAYIPISNSTHCNFKLHPLYPHPLYPQHFFVLAISRMARRSFTLPLLKLTKRPAFSASVKENLHQGVRDVRGVQTQPEPCQENQASFSEFPASADQESETDQCGELKSVRVHFAPGSNGRSFPLEYS